MGIITDAGEHHTRAWPSQHWIHLAEKGVVHLFSSTGRGGSARGYTAGVNAMLYYDFKQKSLYALEASKPGSRPFQFSKSKGMGIRRSAGFAFNSQDQVTFQDGDLYSDVACGNG